MMSSESGSGSGVPDHEFKDTHDSPSDVDGAMSGDDDSDTDSAASLESQLPLIDRIPNVNRNAPSTVFTATASSTFDNSTANVLSCIAQMTKYVAFDLDRSSSPNLNSKEPRSSEIYRTAPIFTSEVSKIIETDLFHKDASATSFAQFGLIGLRNALGQYDGETTSDTNPEENPEENLVIANMDMPWSAFICGSQGAGKSHTLSCLLENALIAQSGIGSLPNPLAAMVFHYDNYSSAASAQVCEAAYLCSSGIPVTVLVCPSNIWAMTNLYANLPGLPTNAPKPKILPLYLAENLLNIKTMQTLMAIDPTSGNTPLYMETVTNILRAMAMEGKGSGAFSYAEFRSRLNDVRWAPGQQVGLNLRLQLLDSFLEPSQFTMTTRPAPATEDIWAFKIGTLTIVDLSDPFVSGSDACSLFSICLSLFMANGSKQGKIVALDEAHKFLTQTGTARALTHSLTDVIRQQRHTGTRVVIATQEPTLSPELIDLANATFVHRFLSPAWYEVLKHHLAGAKKHDSTSNQTSLFETIVGLETGEALLFCPTAVVSVVHPTPERTIIEKLGNGHLKVKIRNRITADGGKSILATDTPAPMTSRISDQIPMHVVTKTVVSKSSVRSKALAPASTSFSLTDDRVQQKTSEPPSGPRAMANGTTTPTEPSKTAEPTQTGGPLQLKDPIMKVARDMTRSIVRKNTLQLGRGDIKKPDLKNIIAEVELGLKQQPKSMLKTPPVWAHLRWVANDELKKCVKRAEQS